MPSRISSLFYMLAPCAVLAGFAFYLSRVPPLPAKPTTNPAVYGPFQLKVEGVEKQRAQPINVYQGYDRHFLLVFAAQGARPKWWGAEPGSLSSTKLKGWTFWLEKEGERHPFFPNKAQLWTSDYDEAKKRYTNEFLLHCGNVPQGWALKARGKAVLTDGNTPLASPIPFEVTLKKVGEKWQPPQLSTETGLIVQSIKIVKDNAYSQKAQITLSSPNLNPPNGGWIGDHEFLDGEWRAPSSSFHYVGTGKTRRRAYWNSFSRGFAGPLASSPTTPHKRVYELDWNSSGINSDPRRDIIAVAHVSINNRWPLEIAFYAKCNGKVPLGEVKALTRPKR